MSGGHPLLSLPVQATPARGRDRSLQIVWAQRGWRRTLGWIQTLSQTWDSSYQRDHVACTVREASDTSSPDGRQRPASLLTRGQLCFGARPLRAQIPNEGRQGRAGEAPAAERDSSRVGSWATSVCAPERVGVVGAQPATGGSTGPTLRARKSGSVSNSHFPDPPKARCHAVQRSEVCQCHSTDRRHPVTALQPGQTRPIQLRAEHRDICPVPRPDATHRIIVQTQDSACSLSQHRPRAPAGLLQQRPRDTQTCCGLGPVGDGSRALL